MVAARSPAVIDGHQVGDQHEGVRQHAGEELRGKAGLFSTSSPSKEPPGCANTQAGAVLTPVTACE